MRSIQPHLRPVSAHPWVVLAYLLFSAGSPPLSCGQSTDVPRTGSEERGPLPPTNETAPFCYTPGGTAEWSIIGGQPMRATDQLLAGSATEQPLLAALPLKLPQLTIDIREGRLIVQAKGEAQSSHRIAVAVQRDGKTVQQQTWLLYPRPPSQPISYISDLIDDLIRIFYDRQARAFREVAKHDFDAYFRRLQAHGVQRMVVWQSPFPMTVDPANYRAEDWQRYARQAQAIIDCEQLTDTMRTNNRLPSYRWLRFLMAARLNPDIGKWYAESAAAHGIRLTASFRPFEMALMKYYQVPVFDEDGRFLWTFLPQASPAVNYHAAELGFAHYREILAGAGNRQAGVVRTIDVGGLQGVAQWLDRRRADEPALRVQASDAPPLDETSFVLVRHGHGGFSLQPYGTMKERVESHRRDLEVQVRSKSTDRLLIDVPPVRSRYLIVSAGKSAEAAAAASKLRWPTIQSIDFRSAAGNQVNRLNFWVAQHAIADAARATRVAGVPADGMYHTDFQAIEESIDYFRHHLAPFWTLEHADLVLDLGDPWSTEMVDFQRPAARQFAVRQLKTILSFEAFDEIMLNTRSHTQLAGSFADGSDGIRTMSHYRMIGRNYYHYGVDRSYAPISLQHVPAIRQLAAAQSSAEITSWQNGEWLGPCQDMDSPYRWRFQRNVAIADGVRQLLQDLEREFPRTRIRAVMPHSAEVEQRVRSELELIPSGNGQPYGADYFRHVWGSGNHIPAIGEGMAMLDLRGLRTEPVLLGIRHLPEDEPLDAFLTACIDDLADNRGSGYRGPKSIVYEAQATLRHADREYADRRRQAIMAKLLARDEIDEILLYEAADWVYAFPLDGKSIPHR